MPEDRRDRRLDRRSLTALAALVFAVAAAAYAPSLRHEFVDWDDPTYVHDNPVVALGLSGAALRRALEPHDGNWIPLTRLSLAIDHALFGKTPAGYHATNALLHAATAALLLLALARATGAAAPAAFVALSFALHPLRVESVAWVAERKDVLSGLFFALAIAAWLAYGRRPSVARYAAALAAGAASLASKPTAVTLPFVLLLLDFWPLARLGERRARRRAVAEKLPFAALAAGAAWIAFDAQREAGAFGPLAGLGLDVRIGNAIVSYAWYARKAFWPTELAAFYPHPGALPAADAIGTALFAGIAITLAAFALARSRPWLCVGWLWFLGMLVPMIGLVQVGMQAHADRYAYLPMLGLEIAIAYEAWAWLSRRPLGRRAFAVATAAIAVALAVAMRAQLAHWRDTETLFSRALAVTENNYLAYERVAARRLAAGDTDEAIRLFGETLRLQPTWASARGGLARALWLAGRRDEALWNHREAVRQNPADGVLRENLARALIELGWSDEAIRTLRHGVARGRRSRVPQLRALLAAEHTRRGEIDAALRQARRAVEADPSLRDTQILLARLLLARGETAEAEAPLRAALELGADDAASALGADLAALHFQLGDVLRRQGREAEAADAYRAALAADPRHADAANNLAWILAASRDPALRDPAEALRLAEIAVSTSERRDANALDTLAVAQAASGRFDDALATIDAALALLPPERAGERAELEARRARFAAREPGIDAETAP